MRIPAILAAFALTVLAPAAPLLAHVKLTASVPVAGTAAKAPKAPPAPSRTLQPPTARESGTKPPQGLQRASLRVRFNEASAACPATPPSGPPALPNRLHPTPPQGATTGATNPDRRPPAVHAVVRP